ncbi:MAG TPA: cytochrome c [Pyrinomonadaceae bacterium]|jgi:mono/diheme cytochrome c family protein|nr:cytochrome c [Pyrinomonadaceae bacterium]
MNCYLKSVVSSSAVVLVLALLLPSGFVSGAFQRKPTARTPPGEELFNSNCARCHGADGRSDTPLGHLLKAPDFTDPEWWKKNSSLTTTKTLRSIVARGKGGMPGFQKKLTRSEINLLVERVRSFRKLERKS